jgi:hypothetical protein
MDRQTTYFGQLALETDILNTGRNGMVALAKLAAAVLGQTTIVNAFTVTPTTPASLNVLLTAGEIYQLENLEAALWSSLTTDSHTILKQGILMDPVTFGITPPGTVGFSQVFLIQVQYADLDTGSVVLPYFNAANPSVPFNGPAGAGTAQNTVRKGIVASQVKAGVAAATGTQVAPTADAGWTGIYTVTVANGAATITSGNINIITTAPFIPVTLPNVPIVSQSGVWTSADDTGTINNIVATLSPVPTQYTKGMRVTLKMANAPTGATLINLNVLGNKSVVKGGGVGLSGGEWAVNDEVTFTYDGTKFQVAALPVGVVQKLTANKTLFVNGAIGNDANDGTANDAAHALATPQAAVNIAFNYAPSQFAITIQILAGTYGPAVTPLYAGPNIIINGASESTVLLDGSTTGPAIAVQGPNTMTIQNLRGQNSAPAGQSPIFLAAAGATMSNFNTGSNGTNNAVIQAFGGTFIVGSHTFRGNCGQLFLGNIGGHIQFQQSAVLTIANAITVSSSSAAAQDDGSIGVPTPLSPTFVNPGNVTGTRFSATTNGVINTSGNGINYFPGTVAGGTSSGGQYV